MKHLWEVNHPYCCNEGNYYSNDCGATYRSWPDFIAAEGDSDLDYNLIFRWGWLEEDEDGTPTYAGDGNYRNGRLLIFFMGQRKGLYRYAEVDICRADEPSVRAFLEPRLAHLLRLWAPLAAPPEDGSQTPPAGDGEGDSRPNHSPSPSKEGA